VPASAAKVRELQQKYPWVHVHQCAVADQPGTVLMNTRADSTSPTNRIAIEDSEANDGISVSVTTLDQVTAKSGIPVICYSMAPVILGERALVSQGVHLCTGSHNHQSENFQLFARPIEIGTDAWICAEAFLAPGVSIGDGAVIGARAVVTRDQPAWMVCAGNPCRPLKPRTPPGYSRT
jgi:acetyltransferase-like isoleucine patch superfamily enzyme